MPLLVAAVGIVFLVAALRGQTTQLFGLIKGDLTGPNNFMLWLGAILGLGLFGYIKQVRPIAGGFLILVGVALVLSNKGFFANFAKAFEATQATTPIPSKSPANGASGATQSGLGSVTQEASDLINNNPFQVADSFQAPSVSLGDLGNLFGGDAGNTVSDVGSLALSLF